jgi:hypothetical protein
LLQSPKRDYVQIDSDHLRKKCGKCMKKQEGNMHFVFMSL